MAVVGFLGCLAVFWTARKTYNIHQILAEKAFENTFRNGLTLLLLCSTN